MITLGIKGFTVGYAAGGYFVNIEIWELEGRRGHVPVSCYLMSLCIQAQFAEPKSHSHSISTTQLLLL